MRRAGLTTALAFLAWTPAAAAQEPIDRSWTGVAGGAQGYRLPPGVVPAIRGFDVGVDEYIVKPLDRAELLRAVRRFLS